MNWYCTIKTRSQMALDTALRKLNTGQRALSFLGPKIWTMIKLPSHMLWKDKLEANFVGKWANLNFNQTSHSFDFFFHCHLLFNINILFEYMSRRTLIEIKMIFSNPYHVWRGIPRRLLDKNIHLFTCISLK